MIARTADEARRALDRAVARQASADWLVAEIEAALEHLGFVGGNLKAAATAYEQVRLIDAPSDTTPVETAAAAAPEALLLLELERPLEDRVGLLLGVPLGHRT